MVTLQKVKCAKFAVWRDLDGSTFRYRAIRSNQFLTNVAYQVKRRKDVLVNTKVWKWIGVGGLVLLAIIMSISLLSVTYQMMKNNAASAAQVSPNACALQESKPVLIITLNGTGAATLCNKIVALSKGRYFTYYGAPSWDYSVMCAVIVKKVQFTVYDIVPSGVTPMTRYSMSKVCSLLQSRHRLIGEGF